MRATQQPAYVLHARAWRETSLQLECLTRDFGRIGMIARGARRARARLSRATLEPFQPLLIDFSGNGELVTLSAAETCGGPPVLGSQGLLAGLYLNELVVRMVARQDPHADLLARYADTLQALAAPADAAWALRRFERDLLADLGYALELRRDADSREVLDPDAEYVYIPAHGPVAWHGQSGLRLRGADLLAFAEDRKPGAAGLAALRGLLRALLAEQVGPAGLRSWQMLGAALRSARRS